ncbi:hypothetical protein EV363DRAFT_1446483 [Boletus edulis]|nr:hypothetical protein EV363DRAFT_1446483 [Boletus edulis]
MSENPPTTEMFYGDEDDPTMWFAKFKRMLPHSWTDTEKVAHFTNHIMPSSYASDWLDALSFRDKVSLETIQTAFDIRWPPPERPQFTRAEQMERIRELVLKEGDIGKWITPSDKRKADYGQNIWANEVKKAAISMGDVQGLLLECALDSIPNILKDHLTCRYSKWEEFQKDIRSVPAHKIKRGKERVDQERARDAEIAQLRAQTSATAATLQSTITQLSQLHLPPSTPYHARPQTNPRNLPPITTHHNFATQNQPYTAPVQGTWPPRRPPPTREQVLERVMAIPQRPNSGEGKQQYKADIDAWHTAHGADAMVSLS